MYSTITATNNNEDKQGEVSVSFDPTPYSNTITFQCTSVFQNTKMTKLTENDCTMQWNLQQRRNMAEKYKELLSNYIRARQVCGFWPNTVN